MNFNFFSFLVLIMVSFSCTEKPCEGVSCQPGYTCSDGDCVCEGIESNNSSICISLNKGDAKLKTMTGDVACFEKFQALRNITHVGDNIQFQIVTNGDTNINWSFPKIENTNGDIIYRIEHPLDYDFYFHGQCDSSENDNVKSPVISLQETNDSYIMTWTFYTGKSFTANEWVANGEQCVLEFVIK